MRESWIECSCDPEYAHHCLECGGTGRKKIMVKDAAPSAAPAGEPKCPTCGSDKPAKRYKVELQYTSGIKRYCEPCNDSWHEAGDAELPHPDGYTYWYGNSWRADTGGRPINGVQPSESSAYYREEHVKAYAEAVTAQLREKLALMTVSANEENDKYREAMFQLAERDQEIAALRNAIKVFVAGAEAIYCTVCSAENHAHNKNCPVGELKAALGEKP